MNNHWHNVSKKEPCPVCHKTDWCSVSNDGEMCVCRREPSTRPCKSGMGWIHVLKTHKASEGRGPLVPFVKPIEPLPDFAPQLEQFGAEEQTLATAAEKLGVSREALQALGTRCIPEKDALVFPMRQANGQITGLRYRQNATGRKWSAKGSKDGLFYAPERLIGDELFITEGPSDTAAALSIGLTVAGRSSCLSGSEILKALIKARHFKRATILADGDAPGINGAKLLQTRLPVSSRVVLPPPDIKDVRQWVRHGATKDSILLARQYAHASTKGAGLLKSWPDPP